MDESDLGWVELAENASLRHRSIDLIGIDRPEPNSILESVFMLVCLFFEFVDIQLELTCFIFLFDLGSDPARLVLRHVVLVDVQVFKLGAAREYDFVEESLPAFVVDEVHSEAKDLQGTLIIAQNSF